MNLGVQTLETIKEWYYNTMAQADPRVLGFPLMQGPERLALVISLYLLVVTQGPRVMAPFKPLELTRLLVVYNFAMVALATYIFVLCVTIIIGDGFNFVCDTVNRTLSGKYGSTLIYEAGWWFMFMKIIEFADTVFFILRKKFSHVTFLHVYHHSTMAIISWVGFKFVPGGQTIMYPLVNSFIHIIMYTYYGMAAMGPHMQKYLWWKRYLTMLQISQFVLLIGQTAVNAMSPCEFPKIFSYTVVIYTFSILLLFLNFYHKAYLSRQKRSSAATATTTATTTTTTTRTKNKAANDIKAQ
ncbi:very long chain fatty acid elongase 4-like [Babylonia areolata]|uniref:very long chain fatty acid elongase 4-like n=1 Tax=Babylonia areolata TaxID=304850 RepID=UPI003FD0AC37